MVAMKSKTGCKQKSCMWGESGGGSGGGSGMSKGFS
jgi:hypothetical protein